MYKNAKRLTSIVHIFRQKETIAFLESAEGKEWQLNIFYDQSARKNVANPAGFEPATSW